MGLLTTFRNKWNAFANRDPTPRYYYDNMSYSTRPDRIRFTGGNERTITNSIYNRIAMDAASITIKHAQLDEENRYIGDIESGLHNCFNIEANLDQTGRAFMQDIYATMLDEGTVALVPTDTSEDPRYTNSYDIYTMRVGKIVEWRPDMVKVKVYNEKNGKKQDIWMLKRNVGIIENPLYSVINEKNSTMQRLVRKLALLDAVDEQSSSGKMDLIIQLPYIVKTESRKKQAEDRRKDIEKQLTSSKYGIAYTDGTEKITQLNRPIENNLLKQIEYLTTMLYSQLGITQTVMDGTADEKTMLSYYNRTIECLVSAVVDELKRKFLTKTARTRKQSIVFFRDPFKLVPIDSIAQIADTFTRNEILTSNEIRQIIGRKPSTDPKADQLLNSNLNHPDGANIEMNPELQDGTQPEMIEE